MQEQNQTPPPPKSNSDSKNVIIAVISVILLSCFGFIAYLMMQLQSQGQYTAPKTAEPESQGIVDDLTAGWEIYTHPTDGWSIKYPSSVEAQEIPQIDPVLPAGCVRISFPDGNGYLAIKSRKGYEGGCTQTGMGAYSVTTETSAQIMIQGILYQFDGTISDNRAQPYSDYEFEEFYRTEALLETWSIV